MGSDRNSVMWSDCVPVARKGSQLYRGQLFEGMQSGNLFVGFHVLRRPFPQRRTSCGRSCSRRHYLRRLKSSCFARRVTPLFFPAHHLGWLDQGTFPIQPGPWRTAGRPGFRAGGLRTGGSRTGGGAGGGPGGVCGLGGLAGDLSLTGAAFFASRTRDPVTDELPVGDLLLRRPFSLSLRCSRFFFFLSRLLELGEERDLSRLLLLLDLSFFLRLG